MTPITTAPVHSMIDIGLRAIAAGDGGSADGMTEMLRLVSEKMAPQRHIVHAGDRIYCAGQPFGHLYLLSAGYARVTIMSADGREQIIGLKCRGDWLGFDGIAEGRYDCDVVATDTGEIWSVRYDALIAAGAQEPRLMRSLHEAMSRQLGRDRDTLMSVCTLPAYARVAEFLRGWSAMLGRRGIRSDEILLRMTRAEIGNHLGLTLETVSRALSRLVREGVIEFADHGRRVIRIGDLQALSSFIQRSLTPATLLQ